MTQAFIRFILYINTLAVPDVASPECLNSRQRISSLEALGAADQWNEGEIGEGRWGAKRMNTFSIFTMYILLKPTCYDQGAVLPDTAVLPTTPPGDGELLT